MLKFSEISQTIFQCYMNVNKLILILSNSSLNHLWHIINDIFKIALS